MSHLNQKKYRVTFNKPVQSISGTVISEESVVEVKLPTNIESVTTDSFAGCTNLDIVEADEKFRKEKGSNEIKIKIAGVEYTLDVSPISGSTY